MNTLKILFLLSVVSFIFGELIRIPIFSIEVKLLDMSVAVIFITWLVYAIYRNNFKKSFYMPTLIFALICVISLFVSLQYLSFYQFSSSLLYLIRWIGYASLLPIVWNFDESFKTRIDTAFLILGALTVFVGYVQFFLYYNLRNLYYLGWDEHQYRMFSVFLDPNFAGAFFVLYFLFLLDKIFDNFKKKNNSIVYGLLSFFALFAVFLTYSRSAVLMLIVGVSIFLLYKNMTKYIALVILAFAFIILAFSTIYNSEGAKFFRLASSEARIDSASQAISVFKSSPVFGVGFNSYKYTKQRLGFHTSETGFYDHSGATTDNSFLFVLATTGIVGFLIYLAMWYKILILNKKSALITSSLIALFANSMFINSLFYAFFMFWIWVIIGLRENR